MHNDQALLDLLSSVDLTPAGSVHLNGDDPLVASPHRLATASGSALAAQGAAVAALWKLRGGKDQAVTVDAREALHGLHTISYMKQNDHPIELHVVKEAITDFYRCGDGRWIFYTGAYPNLRDGVLDVLRCSNSAHAIATATARWSGQDLEDALADKGMAAGIVRTRAEWHAHPQGRQLLDNPPVEIVKLGDSPPEPLAPAARPLSGVRVLDFTHVIAGPLSTRLLAEQGADVLHVSSPHHPDPLPMVMDTGHGKRSAFLDLNRHEDVKRLKALCREADIFVSSWRPGKLDRRGFSPESLAAARPGMIYMSASAYGLRGPWSTRGGFDQQGQSVTGVAAEEGSLDAPRLAPVYYLNDYVTAYLAAFGAMVALKRRAEQGGSYHVRVSLARSSMWVQSLGKVELRDDLDLADLGTPRLQVTETPFGTLEHMAPVVQYSETPARWDSPPLPLGASRAEWLPRG